jgi:predicted O-methyltransferase YrrM
MSNKSIGLTDTIHQYLVKVGVREHPLLARLRSETASMAEAVMQIAPEEGALLAMLVRLMDARRCIELGTFTGYSSLAVAMALPAEGRLVCCDASEEWTAVARRYWSEAGVADRIELRLGPALESLRALADERRTFDLAFVDADKANYVNYYEELLPMMRPGGVVAFDNVLWGGEVADQSVTNANVDAVRALNTLLASDERVDVSMVPIADGLTLARKR